jgi:hypothetical protein
MKPRYNRRDFLSTTAMACSCALPPGAAFQINSAQRAGVPVGAAALFPLGSNLRIARIKTFGVTLPFG